MFNETYNDWNHRRAKAIIDHYGYRFFYGKKILDLGAGHGDMAAAFSRLGADVLCVDVRQENLDIISKKHPHLRTMKINLDQDWPFVRDQFDIILSLGVLCHLKDHAAHIQNICGVAEHIILETEVLDSSDLNSKITIFEDKSINDLSFGGEGSIVSAGNIQNKLSEIGAKFKRVDDAKINSGNYKYDWKESNIGRRFGNRRLWFVRLDKFIMQKLEHQKLMDKGIQYYVPAPQEQEQPPRYMDASQTYFYRPFQPQPEGSYFSHPIKTSNQKDTNTIRLFYNYYEDRMPNRKEEIDFCLRKNLDNSSLQVVMIESSECPTFEFLFQKINAITGPDDINIICNADIYFDNTIELARNIQHKQLYALTCWDVHHQNNIVFRNEANSQDSWIVRGKVEGIFGGFEMGRWASDNRLAYEFHKSGYKVLNPGKSIKTYHCHSSGVRRHSPHNGIPGPHLLVVPVEITND